MIIRLGQTEATSVEISLIGTTDEIEIILEGLNTVKGSLVLGGFCYGTFYAEDDKRIYGVTDDVEERVATRDGEEPAAIIFLYDRK